MCARFELLTFEELEEVLDAVEARRKARLRLIREQIRQRQQAFPGSAVPLLAPGDDGKLAVAEATWGFEADWSKGPVFNTRIESMLSGSMMWRAATENGRCVVPAATFFESHETETEPSPRTGRPVKRAYQFADPAGEPLLLAGVQAEGRCSVVTCEPNRWVAPVHSRMPLVLRFEEVAAWLSPDWPALADRSAIELATQPEHPDRPDQPEHLARPERPAQLSLF